MSERSRVLALLDELYATESAGAAAMTRWLDVAVDPAVRGGLRVIAARDAAHGDLALERLRALGGAPERTPSSSRLDLLRLVEAPDVDDDTKLRAMIERLPSDGGDRVREAAGGIVEDLETRALVETMSDDDRASLAWLRARGDGADPGPTSNGACDLDRTVAGLLVFAEAEAASARVFEAWGAACEHGGLRGGLRTIAAREATHASLLVARLAEVAGPRVTPGTLPDVGDVARRWGSNAWPDAQKLDALLARQPSPETVARPIVRLASVADAETRAMLLLMADGEQATIAWLHAYRRAVPPHAHGAAVPALAPLRRA